MKRIFIAFFVVILVACAFSISVIATDNDECGRVPVNIFVEQTITLKTDLEDENITEYIGTLTDGNTSTGIKSSAAAPSFILYYDFTSAVNLESLKITIQNTDNDAVASGTIGMGNKPNGNIKLVVYIYTENGDYKIDTFDKLDSNRVLSVDLSGYESITRIDVENVCDNVANFPIWEIEAIRYKGEHAWKLTEETTPATCQTEGEGTYTCSCGATKVDKIPKTNHKFDTTWQFVTENVNGTEVEKHYRECSTCPEASKTHDLGEHVYDHDCDRTCNICSKPRAVEGHAYEADCATVCKKCGSPEGRTPVNPNHTYTSNSDCDPQCNLCKETRETTLECKYDNDCDATCSVCNSIREPKPHVYDSECDEFCNVCKAQRYDVETHVYTNSSKCDQFCDKCFQQRENAEAHTWANNCDGQCNACNYIRQEGDENYYPNHLYDTDCDNQCNECGAGRVADHTYANACDAYCDICNTQRTPAMHVFSEQIIKNATEKSQGIMERKCKACGIGDTVIIPKIEKEDNTLIIILVVVACVVVFGGCTAVGVYALVIKPKREKMLRTYREALRKAELEAQNEDGEYEEAFDEEYEEAEQESEGSAEE